MRRIIVPAVFFLLALALFPQQETHEVTVTNVTVPVRVFHGNDFVSDLNIDDFMIEEDGQPQDIEALYLVENTNITRKQENIGYFPNVSRKFFLLFQMIDYNPKLAEAIEYFFKNILRPDDFLSVQTPMKNYALSKEILENRPREVIASDLINIIKKDTKIGNATYNDLLTDLKKMVRSMQSSGQNMGQTLTDMESDSTSSMFSLEFVLPRYKETLRKLEDLRIVDENRFVNFAQSLKRMDGEKTVFFFYQREFRPEISPSVLNMMMSTLQDQPNILADLQDAFQFYHRDIEIEAEKIKRAFADASINFNFIFMNMEPENVIGLTMREQSEDIFKAFSEVAQATGGIVDSSQNPQAGFMNAINSSRAYYLLYYKPKNYVSDDRFHSITVRVKNKDYKVAHRLGYYAD